MGIAHLIFYGLLLALSAVCKYQTNIPWRYHVVEIWNYWPFEENLPITGGLPSQRASDVELWWVAFCWPEQAVEQTAVSDLRFHNSYATMVTGVSCINKDWLIKHPVYAKNSSLLSQLCNMIIIQALTSRVVWLNCHWTWWSWRKNCIPYKIIFLITFQCPNKS